MSSHEHDKHHNRSKQMQRCTDSKCTCRTVSRSATTAIPLRVGSASRNRNQPRVYLQIAGTEMATAKHNNKDCQNRRKPERLQRSNTNECAQGQGERLKFDTFLMPASITIGYLLAKNKAPPTHTATYYIQGRPEKHVRSLSLRSSPMAAWSLSFLIFSKSCALNTLVLSTRRCDGTFVCRRETNVVISCGRIRGQG